MSLSRSYSVRTVLARHPMQYGILILALCAGIAAAQTGTWTAPLGGYLYDSSNRSIRSLTGFIGSAVVGPSVETGIDWASLAPNQKSALAQQNGSQFWIPDLSAAGTSQVLDRVPLAQQAFWAADSSQAVILTGGGELIWLTNFSSGPIPISKWNLESYAPAGSGHPSRALAIRIARPQMSAVWSLLAADSQGDEVLLSLHTGETWQIWFASSTIPPQNIPFSGRPVAAAFSPGAGGIFVADAAGHRVVQIENPDTVPVLTNVISSATYVNDPAALALSSDGKRLFVADHSDSVIRVFDLTAGSVGSSAGGTGDAAPTVELPTGAVPVSLTNFSPDRYIMNAGGSAGQPTFFLNTGVPANMSFVPGQQ